MSATATTISPPSSFPPTPRYPSPPPNSQVPDTRSRTNSLVSATSATPSRADSNTSILLQNANYSLLRRDGAPPRNLGHVNFAEVIEQIQDENPGRFFEGAISAPQNTPAATETETPASPRSVAVPGDELPDLPYVTEVLEPWDGKGFGSPATTPAPSELGGSNMSVASEPLYMTIRQPAPHKKELSPLSTVYNATGTDVEISPTKSITATAPNSDHTVKERERMPEHTDWAAEVEADVQRGLARLANLANDDFQADPTLTAQEHYQTRLSKLLNDTTLRFLYGDVGTPPMPAPGPDQTPSKGMQPLDKDAKSPAIAPMPVPKTEYATTFDVNKLLNVVDDVVRNSNRLVDTQNKATQNVKTLQKKFEGKMAEQDSHIRGVKDENARLREELEMLKKMVGKGSESTTKLGDDEERSHGS